jgi:DNA oxidative demethylase
MAILPVGVKYLPGHLEAGQQRGLLALVGDALATAPPYTPSMPRTGKPFSVAMSNFGPLGWVSDRAGGYRYQATHPVSGQTWPPIPSMLLDLWDKLAEFPAPPEACLVNLYVGSAKMGSHADTDELEFAAPVLSISLGDAATFHIGGIARSDPKVRLRLESGDIVILGGSSRRAYHGIDRVHAGTSTLVPGGGRINLTLRRVTRI